MIRKVRWMWVTSGVIAAMTLTSAEGVAADKSKVNQATRRVERGAKQIGEGQIGPGFKEMFAGIGHTIVEGAKFSGANIQEFFSGKK